MLLLGGTGAGKTTLAAAIWRAQADRVLAPGATVRELYWAERMVWVHAKALSTARREAPLGHEVPLLREAKRASVLVLDDLGQDAEADKDDVVDVLQEREAAMRPTILTCGFGLERLAKYGEHIVRRLTERTVKITVRRAP